MAVQVVVIYVPSGKSRQFFRKKYKLTGLSTQIQKNTKIFMTKILCLDFVNGRKIHKGQGDISVVLVPRRKRFFGTN